MTDQQIWQQGFLHFLWRKTKDGLAKEARREGGADHTSRERSGGVLTRSQARALNQLSKSSRQLSKSSRQLSKSSRQSTRSTRSSSKKSPCQQMMCLLGLQTEDQLKDWLVRHLPAVNTPADSEESIQWEAVKTCIEQDAPLCESKSGIPTPSGQVTIPYGDTPTPMPTPTPTTITNPTVKVTKTPGDIAAESLLESTTVLSGLDSKHAQQLDKVVQSLPLPAENKAAIQQNLKQGREELKDMLQRPGWTQKIVAFANLIYESFKRLWKRFEQTILEFQAANTATANDPKKQQEVLKEIAKVNAESDGTNKSWWRRLLSGTGSVLKGVGSWVWSGIWALGSLLFSAIKKLGAAGFSLAMMVVNNPSVMRMALILAKYFRNVLCRRIASWWYDQNPREMNMAADVGGDLIRGGVGGAVRTFVNSSWYDKAFDAVSNFAVPVVSSGVGGLVTLVTAPFLGPAAPAAGAAFGATAKLVGEAVFGVVKEATAELTTLMTYYEDVKSGLSLILDLFDVRNCIAAYNAEVGQIKTEIASSLLQVAQAPTPLAGGQGYHHHWLRSGGAETQPESGVDTKIRPSLKVAMSRWNVRLPIGYDKTSFRRFVKATRTGGENWTWWTPQPEVEGLRWQNEDVRTPQAKCLRQMFGAFVQLGNRTIQWSRKDLRHAGHKWRQGMDQATTAARIHGR